MRDTHRSFVTSSHCSQPPGFNIFSTLRRTGVVSFFWTELEKARMWTTSNCCVHCGGMLSDKTSKWCSCTFEGRKGAAGNADVAMSKPCSCSPVFDSDPEMERASSINQALYRPP